MPLNYGPLTSMKFEPARLTYVRKDTILHALSVGIGALDPCDPDELKYLRPPGLQAKIWKQGPGDAAFRLIASERGLVVEDLGRVEWAE